MKVQGSITHANGVTVSGIFQSAPEWVEDALNVSHNDILMWLEDENGNAKPEGTGFILGGGAIFQLSVVPE